MTREELLKISKPILFNEEMVQALLEGRKTVTRRTIKLPKHIEKQENGLYTLQAEGDYYFNQHLETIINYLKSPYQVGDILYVRETFRYVSIGEVGYEGECLWDDEVIQFKASEDEFHKEYGDYIGEYDKWKPSIHMPKSAARIFLKVTDVRVERVQDITDYDAEKEMSFGLMRDLCAGFTGDYKTAFEIMWNSIYGDWEANPFVWVVEFERVIPK